MARGPGQAGRRARGERRNGSPVSGGQAGRDAYARAGVDVDAGERAVELMRASVAGTRRPEVLGGLGGFGSAVCEVAAEVCPVPVLRIGVQDVFGESGSPEALYEKFNFHPKGIADAVRAFVGATAKVS